MNKKEVLRPVRHELVDIKGREIKQHLVVFRKPFMAIVNKRTIRCFLFNWTLTHGKVKGWDWIDGGDHPSLAGDELGLLVPRFFWWLWWFLSIKLKVNSFTLDAVPYEGPVPYYE